MRSFRGILVLAAVLIPLGGGLLFLRRPASPGDAGSPELTTPRLALQRLAPLRGKPLFFTSGAVPALKECWGDWAPAFGSPAPAPEELAATFDAAAVLPSQWRVLDRQWRFGALLLTGDPVRFHPLLDYLRQAPDWRMTYLDPASYLFERVPAREWTPAEVRPMLESFASRPVAEQRQARVLAARRLAFVGETDAARNLLDEVLKAEPKSAPAWTELANLHTTVGRWQEALDAATRALECDPRSRSAQSLQANAWYSLGRFGNALEITRKLYQAAPGDEQTLYLHAKVAHAAHAYREEIEALERLIGLLQPRSRPVGLWQIYLGQAYSATGEHARAAAQFEAAQSDTTLSGDDREFLRKALERLRPVSESSLLDASAVHF